MPAWRIGGIHRTAHFFVFVILFTLHLEYFLSSFEVLTELNELREVLGCGVTPLDDELFLPLLWEQEL